MLMIGNKFRVIILGATLAILPLAALALSQFDNFTLKVTPGNPGPNQAVKAEVVSYNMDVNSAAIVWKVNDKIVASGIGVKKIDLTTGVAGSITRIQVEITSASGGKISQSSTLVTGDIDLLWHADAYTPPYYFGKGLLATKSAVTITAIPHLYKNGQKLSADSLIYEWRLDDWNLGEKSGYNKQALTFVADGFSIHREHLVEVTISDRNRTVSAGKSLTLAPSNVEDVPIYQNNPLSGPLYNKALPAISLPPGTDTQLIAIPFNFALAGLESLDYLWNVNGQSEAEVPSKKYLFNFRSLSDAGGRVNVGLQISNKLHPTQSAAAQLNIKVE
ncbi:MAG: hypothetical protein HZA25_03480 [Candidatus Niyogibacteria bacterium]|nr:hypothetical protein [Candidatus Niyogibacteria bacterium]